MSAQVRRWRPHLRTWHTIGSLAREINPVVRWMQYYGAFYRSALLPLLRRINAYLMRWIRKKYKRLAPAKKARACWKRLYHPVSPAVRPLGVGVLFLVDRMTGAG
jgi:RNA-directed DNA polymerase